MCGPESAEPVGVLWVAVAEGKHGIGQPRFVRSLRTDPDDDRAVAALFDRHPMIGNPRCFRRRWHDDQLLEGQRSEGGGSVG